MIFREAIIISAVIHKFKIIKVYDILSKKNILEEYEENIDVATRGLNSIMVIIKVNGDFLMFGRRGNIVNAMILIIKSC